MCILKQLMMKLNNAGVLSFIYMVEVLSASVPQAQGLKGSIWLPTLHHLAGDYLEPAPLGENHSNN